MNKLGGYRRGYEIVNRNRLSCKPVAPNHTRSCCLPSGGTTISADGYDLGLLEHSLSFNLTRLSWPVQCPSMAAKIVLLCLADHYNDVSGKCNPSVALMAKECQTSPRTVHRALKELEKAGLIVKTRTRNSNWYEIQFCQPDIRICQVGVSDMPDSHIRCAQLADEPVSNQEPTNKEEPTIGVALLLQNLREAVK